LLREAVQGSMEATSSVKKGDRQPKPSGIMAHSGSLKG